MHQRLIKAFNSLFCTASDAKSTKGGGANIQSDQKTMSQKRKDSSCMFTLSGKVRKGAER